MQVQRGHLGRVAASGAALVVVLAIVGVVVMLRTGGTTARVGGVTASTPPDAVHVVVTKDAVNSTVETATPGVYTDGGPYHGVVLDKTFTDATTAQRLQQDLTPDTSTPPANCPAGSRYALLHSSYELTYDFTFTAGGQAVEHAVLSVRCDTWYGVQVGFTPTLALSTEHGTPTHGVLDIVNVLPFIPLPPYGPGSLTTKQP